MIAVKFWALSAGARDGPRPNFGKVARLCSGPTGRTEEWLMIDALFWYTGLTIWVLVVLGVVSTLVIEAHDRSVLRRGEQFNRR